MADDPQVTWHRHNVSRPERESRNGHPGCVVWFTGLSGSGKSTIANLVDRRLHDRGTQSYLLDGDNIRHGLNAGANMLDQLHGDAFAERFGLGFSADDREENIRRIGAVAQLFCDAGVIVLTAFVSPYRRDRDAVRQAVEKAGCVGDFIEVFVDSPLEICENRDPKGLYQKARAGLIQNFTGVDDPYEPPASPELTLNSGEQAPEQLANQVISQLVSLGKLGVS